MNKDGIENNPISKDYPSLILGLDISTACIGISIIYDNGVDEPQIEFISHVSPKIKKGIVGIEALILRKEIFENEFLSKMDNILENINCPLKKITECVIESPMIHTSAGSNASVVAKLLQFNGLLSEAIYKKLNIVPFYISSYEARMLSFPELLSIRKFNKKGELYPLKHFKKALSENALILFGTFPFDCDKKQIMMNMVNEKYPNIQWVFNKKNQLIKENFDSCDSLVCILAYSNLKRYGEINAKILDYNISENDGKTEIEYRYSVWDKIFNKKVVLTQ